MSATRPAPLVVELAGPAGSGKSTVVSVISARHPVRLGVTACDRACILPAVRLALLLPPGFLLTEIRRGELPPVTLRSMIYVERWLKQVSATRGGEISAVLYDHGPFFRLATIEAFGPPRSARLDAWWRSMREAWSTAIDLVVWLDADDPVLLERIRDRAREHPARQMGDAEAVAWIRRYRRGFESALAVVARRRPEDLVRIDSTNRSPDAIAEAVVARIEAHHGGG